MSSPEPAQERTPANAERELCVKAMEAMEIPEAADAPASQESAEALGKAMQGLSVKQPASTKPAVSTRVNAADVTFIMGEMEVSKAKATDALRACGGNVTEALRKFIYA